MQMEKLTPGIAAVILLLMTLAVISYDTAFSNVPPQRATPLSFYDFRIESVDVASNIVTLRNTGRATLSNLAVYLNDEPLSVTYSPITPDAAGDLFINEPILQGEQSLRVKSGGVEQIITVNVPSMWAFEDFSINGR